MTTYSGGGNFDLIPKQEDFKLPQWIGEKEGTDSILTVGRDQGFDDSSFTLANAVTADWQTTHYVHRTQIDEEFTTTETDYVNVFLNKKNYLPTPYETPMISDLLQGQDPIPHVRNMSLNRFYRTTVESPWNQFDADRQISIEFNWTDPGASDDELMLLSWNTQSGTTVKARTYQGNSGATCKLVDAAVNVYLPFGPYSTHPSTPLVWVNYQRKYALVGNITNEQNLIFNFVYYQGHLTNRIYQVYIKFMYDCSLFVRRVNNTTWDPTKCMRKAFIYLSRPRVVKML